MAIKVCLEEILKERGMTSKELCSLVNITEANLSEWHLPGEDMICWSRGKRFIW